MTDIWNEKPDSFYKELLSYGHYYEAGSMDAWLEKLEAETDNKDEIITRLLRNTVSLKEKLKAIKEICHQYTTAPMARRKILDIIESSEFNKKDEK